MGNCNVMCVQDGARIRVSMTALKHCHPIDQMIKAHIIGSVTCNFIHYVDEETEAHDSWKTNPGTQC